VDVPSNIVDAIVAALPENIGTELSESGGDLFIRCRVERNASFDNSTILFRIPWETPRDFDVADGWERAAALKLAETLAREAWRSRKDQPFDQSIRGSEVTLSLVDLQLARP